MNFGQALEVIKEGKKAKRAHWGGYWFIAEEGLKGWEVDGSTLVITNKMIVAKLKDKGGYAPATAYQEDLLAEDWSIVE